MTVKLYIISLSHTFCNFSMEIYCNYLKNIHRSVVIHAKLKVKVEDRNVSCFPSTVEGQLYLLTENFDQK